MSVCLYYSKRQFCLPALFSGWYRVYSLKATVIMKITLSMLAWVRLSLLRQIFYGQKPFLSPTLMFPSTIIFTYGQIFFLQNIENNGMTTHLQLSSDSKVTQTYIYIWDSQIEYTLIKGGGVYKWIQFESLFLVFSHWFMVSNSSGTIKVWKMHLNALSKNMEKYCKKR